MTFLKFLRYPSMRVLNRSNRTIVAVVHSTGKLRHYVDCRLQITCKCSTSDIKFYVINRKKNSSSRTNFLTYRIFA